MPGISLYRRSLNRRSTELYGMHAPARVRAFPAALSLKEVPKPLPPSVNNYQLPMYM